MKKLISMIIFSGLLFTFIGCSSFTQPKKNNVLEERREHCPWCMTEPEIKGQYLYFVGISGVWADEQDARNDAPRNSIRRVIEHLGSQVKLKFERAKVSIGLSSDFIDPIRATREFERYFSEYAVHGVKTTKWYVEIEEGSSGKGYKYFVLATIPSSTLNETYKKVLEQEKKKAEENLKEYNDSAKEDQAEKVAKLWADLERQGLIE